MRCGYFLLGFLTCSIVKRLDGLAHSDWKYVLIGWGLTLVYVIIAEIIHKGDKQ